MVLPLAEAPIRPRRADLPTVVHPTIDLLQEQSMEIGLQIPLVEISLPPTIQEAPKAGQVLIPPALVLQAEWAQEVVTVLQAEAQVDPQVVRAQEDQEEGGINSPLFFRKIIRKSTLLR